MTRVFPFRRMPVCNGEDRRDCGVRLGVSVSSVEACAVQNHHDAGSCLDQVNLNDPARCKRRRGIHGHHAYDRQAEVHMRLWVGKCGG